MANLITCCRFMCSAALIFQGPGSIWFYILYLTAGLSDMLDGFIARKTKTETETGAKLDSIADLFFLVICLFKLIPVMEVPKWIWIWAGVIAVARIGNLVLGVIRGKRLVMLHIWENKLTGCMLFLLPLIMPFLDLNVPAILVCTAASAATVRESCCIWRERGYYE